VYSAARRDATHYPHPAHIPKFGIRRGAPFHHLGNVMGAGKFMFQCRFSIWGCPGIVRLLGKTFKSPGTQVGPDAQKPQYHKCGMLETEALRSRRWPPNGDLVHKTSCVAGLSLRPPIRCSCTAGDDLNPGTADRKRYQNHELASSHEFPKVVTSVGSRRITSFGKRALAVGRRVANDESMVDPQATGARCRRGPVDGRYGAAVVLRGIIAPGVQRSSGQPVAMQQLRVSDHLHPH
jgi:hypothetical protein